MFKIFNWLWSGLEFTKEIFKKWLVFWVTNYLFHEKSTNSYSFSKVFSDFFKVADRLGVKWQNVLWTKLFKGEFKSLSPCVPC